MKLKLNESVSVATLAVIMGRHTEAEGLCRSCKQPWPCDVRIIKGLVLTKAD